MAVARDFACNFAGHESARFVATGHGCTPTPSRLEVVKSKDWRDACRHADNSLVQNPEVADRVQPALAVSPRARFERGIDRLRLGCGAGDRLPLSILAGCHRTPIRSATGAAFYSGAAAHDTDDRIIYNAKTGEVFYDADGTGATAAVQFATVTGQPALHAADFWVI